MTYHPLTNTTGGDSERRLEEAADLVDKLAPYLDQLSDKERAFVEQMGSLAIDQVPTPRQVLFLRDIWSKFA